MMSNHTGSVTDPIIRHCCTVDCSAERIQTGRNARTNNTQ